MSDPRRTSTPGNGTPRTPEERRTKLKQQRSKRLLPGGTGAVTPNGRLTVPRRTSSGSVSSASSESSAISSISLVFDPPTLGKRNRLCYPEVGAPGEPFKSISLRTNEKLVFLAGGVQGPDWRQYLSDKLEHYPGLPNLAFVRPKLPDPSLYGTLFEELINWEIEHFHQSPVIVFWFHRYTLCPITLVEFGQWAVPYASKATRPYKVIVGADPEYAKVQEIKCYCKNRYTVHDNLDDLAKATARALKGM